MQGKGRHGPWLGSYLDGDCDGGPVHKRNQSFFANATSSGADMPDGLVGIPCVWGFLDLPPTCAKYWCYVGPMLGQLQPFITVFSQECMGQLASFGPT